MSIHVSISTHSTVLWALSFGGRFQLTGRCWLWVGTDKSDFVKMVRDNIDKPVEKKKKGGRTLMEEKRYRANP